MLSRVIAILLALPVLAVAVLLGASEFGGEVVVLETTGGRGEKFATSLWVVDVDGSPMLRAGNPDSEWLDRIRAEPAVALIRDELRTNYQAEIIPDYAAKLNELMRERYGIADQIVSVLQEKDEVVAVRLVEP
jgi:hypothetical protein